MNSVDLVTNTSINENTEGFAGVDSIIALANKLDFVDIQILRRFYMTGKEFPHDTQPCCFPILYTEMRANGQIKIGMEGLRKRLNNLVRVGLLGKIRHSNPTNYEPIVGKEDVIRALIKKFFFINGLTKYL